MDFDLRLVRYFTVVADELNFGRAATALHLAQPSLSRQIQRLEDQLGVRLFDRTPQGSRLTEAGRAFLPRARALLDAAREAELAARSAAPPHAIAIGYVGDLIITPAVRELRRRYPGAKVGTRHLTWRDTHVLPERRVDALVARLPLPFPTDRLHLTVLYEEPRVLVVPTSHRLAGKESVAFDEVADEEFVPCTSSPTMWSGPAEVGFDDSFEDKLEFVAEGRALAVLPAGDGRSALRPDLTAIPLEGVDPCEVVVLTRLGDPNPLATAFHDVAAAYLTGS
ncbi:LysR family transcriptional regulator [Amycolatopsis sp. CA-230715]|uniref:LysR family transcriptional regulator n=1 Tax=Amycolatopsis sp. CA-230715 TaxID=2745196 RepID=UPI001C031695|nr:LysR family transcriptional regulator [Amycolatopsis sp. CA-230715]QWF82350.1 HTH-type transcriptional regulator BenM [Amycolatopsis sp. CA-230715]